MHSTATADSRPHDQLVVNVDNSPGAAIAARMDRLPITRHLWMLVLLISLGGFFEVYDLIFTGYIAPGMTKSGVLQTTTHAFFGFTGIAGFIAATFAGLFVGTFGLGWLPDRYGRRSVFTVSLLWYSVGSVIMAFQTTPEGMIFWRFITGIGVGVEIITIDSYVTEVVPQHMRGRAMAFNQSVMFAAAPVAAILSYWLVPTTVFGIEGWRIVVLAGAAGALLVWFIRRGVPESPRWLAIRGKLDESDAIVRNIEAIVERQSGRSLPPPSQVVVQPKHRRASLAELWQQPYRSRMVILIVFNFCQAIGYYGFASWVPTLLISQGITVTKSLLYSFIIAFALPIGPLLAMAVADRIQRKYLIVGGALIVIVCGMAFAHARTMAPLIILGVLISFAGQIISVCYHAYQAELFPTAIRGRANGIVYSASRVGAMMSGFLIAFLLRDFGVPGVFAGITACMLMVAVSIGLFGPKTNGVRLEELNH
ncbi:MULTISPECIES: MFS transporter [unclassified Burkholderia]|uniref:MFS transporter n=1 Tax=unclassified Burkholderia TaxID=2613784 RepID=UPI000F58C7A5|nr:MULTISPECIES: MFS transporter [unclassified Burkholderia]RQR81630.1 MFS transporter [Burkholderia sp. Bp9011]RQR91331.1 MFS transporter [Burkholderia sp. Bp9010]RQS40493.1 MFS transporter [Burkholderia sp. Bp8990]RQS75746.1 MFS transporter [Burkholderia sp. Bp8977]RQZ47757.1 MFS transporter [Burkholderia sp. Bp9099]